MNLRYVMLYLVSCHSAIPIHLAIISVSRGNSAPGSHCNRLHLAAGSES